MNEFFLDQETKVLLKEHERLFRSVLNQFNMSKKAELVLLLEIERELGAREERG